jgi:cell division protein FtsZ
MTRGGGAYMAIGLGEGEEKAPAAIKQALHHPLLEIDGLDSASGVLVHFTGGEDLTLYEVGEAVNELRNVTTPDIDIILGATTDPAMTGRAQVILIFTGVGGWPVAATQGIDEIAIASSSQVKSNQIEDLDLPTFLRRRAAVGSRS